MLKHLLFMAVLVASAFSAQAQSLPVSSSMPYYGEAQAPYGFIALCNANPQACAPLSSGQSDASGRMALTAETLAFLQTVNEHVNRLIRPVDDETLYGVTERWVLLPPQGGAGDCEDYALLKQHLLVKLGFPLSALALTVVHDEKGLGHAILTARTSQGDYILDNKGDKILPWHEATQRLHYRFHLRQSFLNPHVWVNLEPPLTTASTR